MLAEDLGLVTQEVTELREQFGLPGMRILQFAFGQGDDGLIYRPHSYDPNTFVYTGTHDNDTVQGWLESGQGRRPNRQARASAAKAWDYAGHVQDEPFHWAMIRLALSSVARTAIFPVQDVLGLGGDARMNMPGTAFGNWSWRLQPKALTASSARRLLELNDRYDRLRHLPTSR